MLDKKNIPRHIAFIMDGNGRWAQQRGLGRTAGHRQGIKRVKEVIRFVNELGIEVVTFFAFSAENWSRPKKEIDALMRYLEGFLKKEVSQMHKNNMRFIVIGRSSPLPAHIQKKIASAQKLTRNNSGLKVVLALNYGSRQEIVDAARGFAEEVALGRVEPASLNIERFARYLYTAGLPEPDLLIRTSAEMRLSNFLLWQLSYAELYFPDKFWPDFGRVDLEEALLQYQKRQRRFGGIDDNQENR